MTTERPTVDDMRARFDEERRARIADLHAVLNELRSQPETVLASPEFGPQSEDEKPIYLREEAIARVRALLANHEAATRQIDRLVHGREIESDKICDHALRVQMEMDADRNRSVTRVTQLLTAGSESHVALWDAINKYADTKGPVSYARMEAVAVVERMLRAALLGPEAG